MTQDTGYVHPHRYPHFIDKPEKGQVWDGECNITRCNNRGAQWWNRATFGLYCASCAREINFHPGEPTLCIHVEEKPDREAMLQHHDEYMEELRTCPARRVSE